MICDCLGNESVHTEDMGSDQPRGRKIGYVRVSDADQSEALQIDALKAAGCSKLYTDHGLSGAKTHRPGLRAMLDDLTEGDTLTVWKLDRLGRSTIHLLQILEDLRERGIHFHAITQGIDTSTAVGRMIFGQLAVFAEYERSLISERTKAGMAAAKARGVHVGRPRLSKMAEAVLDELSQVEMVYSITDEELEDPLEKGSGSLPHGPTKSMKH
ncbi:recombinase family protein [Pseudaestuariivita rosea]|uniref:recombinase family protein n=1 Tax=Pseudaestuariivita rosea TaxID=2763263 RepID=UPI001F38F01A|nr:recombinase family protein [Pseudaestuariivita rosea]